MKRAIVIGATSGIGRRLAEILAENDYKVGITGRRSELLAEIAARDPNRFVIHSFDVTETDFLENHLKKLVENLGGLDLMIISSGIGLYNKYLEFEPEQKTIDTNVRGYTCIADWTFNYFQKQKSGQLVGISSVAGIRGSRTAPAYNASKAYQINYLEGLRVRAKKFKLPVTITDIRPGYVQTDILHAKNLFWVADVDKASRQIYRAIKSKKKVAYITRRWRLMAFVLRIVPKFLYERVM